MLNELFDLFNEHEYKKSEAKMMLAAEIADIVESKGWNKKRFAQEMNQKPSVITRWLSGTHNFTIDTLFDIQEKLGVEMIQLNTSFIPFFKQRNDENLITSSTVSFSTVPLDLHLELIKAMKDINSLKRRDKIQQLVSEGLTTPETKIPKGTPSNAIAA